MIPEQTINCSEYMSFLMRDRCLRPSTNLKTDGDSHKSSVMNLLEFKLNMKLSRILRQFVFPGLCIENIQSKYAKGEVL
jgi:hypothetical protein